MFDVDVDVDVDRNKTEVGHMCRGSVNLATAVLHGTDSMTIVISQRGQGVAHTLWLKANNKLDRQRWLSALEYTQSRIAAAGAGYASTSRPPHIAFALGMSLFLYYSLSPPLPTPPSFLPPFFFFFPSSLPLFFTTLLLHSFLDPSFTPSFFTPSFSLFSMFALIISLYPSPYPSY